MASSVPPTSLRTATETPDIEVLDSLASLRAWRQRARNQNKGVGFVPTMGALHDGHLALVQESLRANPLTIVSIFVNPAQFAPHEDLATYPRTLESDLRRLREVSVELPRSLTQSSSSGVANLGGAVSPMYGDTQARKPTVFIPPIKDMYPSGITTNVAEQRGAFVQVKGLEEQMEGQSRPGFFRGVATVVLKLFNAVEPTNAYFGQKDIQQALLLRRLTSDLLLSHPTPENLHIVPTTRDTTSGLALSSRNMYLNEKEKLWAPTLWKALQVGMQAWEAAVGEDVAQDSTHAEGAKRISAIGLRERVTGDAQKVIQDATARAEADGVTVRLDYVQLNWANTLEPVEEFDKRSLIAGSEAPDSGGRAMILSGAMWVGRTRLIDNMILGEEATVKKILS